MDSNVPRTSRTTGTHHTNMHAGRAGRAGRAGSGESGWLDPVRAAARLGSARFTFSPAFPFFLFENKSIGSQLCSLTGSVNDPLPDRAHTRTRRRVVRPAPRSHGCGCCCPAARPAARPQPGARLGGGWLRFAGALVGGRLQSPALACRPDPACRFLQMADAVAVSDGLRGRLRAGTRAPIGPATPDGLHLHYTGCAG